ncbi:transposable element Tcb1 transposase [Trichonephila clavipes]|nr:transposable element Tcb1 transposase [Trichonephila clavipes]
MPPRRNLEKFQKNTEFERGRIIGLREGGFSYCTIGARVQRNSCTVMRVWKQGNDEHLATRNTGSGRRKVTSACDDRHLLRMAVNDRTASSRQLAARSSTATGVLMSASSIHRHPLHHGLRQGCLYTGSLSQQTIDSCVCNGLMSTETGKLIVTKFSFQMNHTSICRTMIAAFVLNAMPVYAAFQSLLPNDIVAQHPELWFGVQFRIKDDPICYKFRAISMATGTSVKCYSPKSFLSFKASLELSFSRIMYAHMLQKLFETSVQPNMCNFFPGLLVRRICRLMSTCGIWLVDVSLVIHVLQLQKTNFCCAYKQYGILFHKQTPYHVV